MEDKKGFIITIIVLIVIILSLGGYIAFDTIRDKKAAEKKTTIVDGNNIDPNAFFNISYILDSFDKAFNNPKSDYVGYIYVPKRLKASKFDMGAAIYASMIQDMTVSPRPKPYYVPEIKVKYNFEKIFGKNLAYKVDQVQSGEVYKVAYYDREDPPIRYDYFAPAEENPYSDRYISLNYKTTVEEDKVIVERRIFYAEFTPENDYQTINLYTDHSKNTKIGSLPLKNGYINEDQLLGSYGSKLMKYKYTFVSEGGSDYSFYSIEAVTK